MNKSKWTDVRDRLPENYQEVLTYEPKGWSRAGHGAIEKQKYMVAPFGEDLGDWWLGGNQNHLVERGDITYWMPLPSPPEGDKTCHATP